MEEIKNSEEKHISRARYLPEISIEALAPKCATLADRAGWKIFTPVQAKSIPYFLAGRDMMVQSRTGSGKTGVYLLPIMQKINIQHDVAQALGLFLPANLPFKYPEKPRC